MVALTAELPTLSMLTARGLSRFSIRSIESARAEVARERPVRNFMMDDWDEYTGL